MDNLIMIDEGHAVRTNHPDAMRVARELGVKAGFCNKEQTLYIVNCCKADFDEILAELGPVNPKFNHDAYAKIQFEGYDN